MRSYIARSSRLRRIDCYLNLEHLSQLAIDSQVFFQHSFKSFVSFLKC